MLRPGQATDIFPSCAAQGATMGPPRGLGSQALCLSPALSSPRQEAAEIVFLPVILGGSLPIRLRLLCRMGYADINMTGLTGTSTIRSRDNRRV